MWKALRSTALAVGFGLALLAGLLLGACAGRNQVDPLDPFRAAMKAEYAGDIDRVADAPRYAMDVEFDAASQLLRGRGRITVKNPTDEPWSYLTFRLYPMLPAYGGNMRIRSIAADSSLVSYDYEADNTAIRVDLPEPLFGDAETTIDISWEAEVPRWPDAASAYALFGTSQQMTSLPLFYPALAVYQPGLAPGTGDWWTEMGSARGDMAFNASSLFVVTATLPVDQVPVASGTLVTSTLTADGRARHVWVTGPNREFLLHMSPLFSSASADAYGTRVTSFWLPGQEAAGRAALQYAVSALRIYSDLFGPYPYRDMSVAPAPLSARGMEYPQVNLLGAQLYDRSLSDLELLVAHEVAHQWWYQIVHNDPINSPWLDEAISEYATKLYTQALRGQAEADLLQLRRWETPLAMLRERGQDVPVDGVVDSFDTGSQYETVIYGKGALFYDQMRAALGDRRFIRFLREYLEQHRYAIVTTAEWQAAMEKLGSPVIDQLYEDWIAPAPGNSAPKVQAGSTISN